MEAQAGCGTAFGLQYLYRFLDAAAKQIMPPEEVTVERTRFAVQRPLGEGGFSYVYLVREVPDARGQDFALKRVLLQDGQDEDEDEDEGDGRSGPARFGNSAVEREIAVMRALDHPNVLPLLRAEVDPSNPRVEANVEANAVSSRRRAHMVFPVFSEGTMLDRCVAKPPGAAFTIKQLLSVARQVCLALVYLHEHEQMGPLAHRDVKPGNVLLESSMEQTGGLRAVLMDFGSTRPARISVNDRAGALRVQERAARECTAPFRAPELFDTPSLCDIDERVDVWSLGCLLFAGDAGGRSPFEDAMGQTGGSLALAVLSGKVTWPARNVAGREKNDEIPDERAPLRDVVAFLLQKDWRERPTARDAVARIETWLERLR
jgi:serine/threonine kinase 16